MWATRPHLKHYNMHNAVSMEGRFDIFLHRFGEFRSCPRVSIRGHATADSTEHEMQRRLLLNVVIGDRATVLELLTGEDQALLAGRDAGCMCE